MVAVIAKQPTERQVERLWAWINDALHNLEIDMDGDQAYALVPSQNKSVKYKVLFVEPKGVPYATDCTCYDHRTNGNTCKHMYLVNMFYDMIYGIHRSPAIYDEAPEEETEMSQDCPSSDMSVREHLIEEETGRYERNMRHPHTSLDDLKSYALREQLDVKIKRGAGTYKEQYIQALLAHQRQKLEAKYQESAPVIEAPKAVPQAQKFESRDLSECGTLNRSTRNQGFRGVFG